MAGDWKITGRSGYFLHSAYKNITVRNVQAWLLNMERLASGAFISRDVKYLYIFAFPLPFSVPHLSVSSSLLRPSTRVPNPVIPQFLLVKKQFLLQLRGTFVVLSSFVLALSLRSFRIKKFLYLSGCGLATCFSPLTLLCRVLSVVLTVCLVESPPRTSLPVPILCVMSSLGPLLAPVS